MFERESIHVLLVDDELPVADLAATMLECICDDISVEVETTVADALRRIKHEDTLDCIVSDYNMPDMTGLAFFEVIRESDPEIPFILFTGRGSEEIASEAISAGVTNYLQKGTSDNQYKLLANRIVSAVESYRSERAAAELERITHVINHVQRELVGQSTREDIEDAVCECFAASEPYTLAWIGIPDDTGEVRYRSWAGKGAKYLKEVSIRTDDTPRGNGPAGVAFRTGEPQATSDIAGTASFEPWREVAGRYDHASVIAIPLSYDDIKFGILSIYSSRSRAFQGEERAALRDLAGTIGQAIHAAETRKELERRERDLRNERTVTSGLLEAMPDPVYAFDDEGKMVRWNSAFAQTVGYTDEEIAEKDVLHFIPESERERISRLGQKVVEQDATISLESEFETKSGEILSHEFSGARFTKEEGGVGVIGSARDIAERKRREKAITALHEATREIMQANDEEEVAKVIAEAVADVLGFPVTAVRLHDATTDVLEPVAVTDTTERILGERSPLAHGEGLPWQAFESGEPILTVGNKTSHSANDLPLQSVMYVPLDEYGTISVGSSDDDFRDTDVRLAQMLASNAVTYFDRLEHNKQLERYEQMLNAAGDALYLLDLDGTIQYGNAAVETLTGYDVEDLVGEHISTIQNPEDTARGREIVSGLMAAASMDGSGESFTVERGRSFENEIQVADGSTIPCESHITLLEVNGEIEGVVGVARNIAERKERERIVETLHDTTRRMMNAKAKKTVAQIAVEAIERVFGMPINGIWLYDETAGKLRPEAISERGKELFENPPTYTTNESLSWIAFERGETRQYNSVNKQTNVKNPDTPIRSEIIVPLGDYGVINIGSMESGMFDDRDVSLANLLAANTEAALHRAERERQLRGRERELKRQTERLDEFASVVSHDLRNPLGVARGRLELAHTESLSDHYEDIQWALSRMDSLISDLLELARQGQVIGEIESISLETIAQQAWQTTGFETASLNILEIGSVEGDASRLERLFENLFRNAIEHAGEDVVVTVGPLDETVGFYIADNGPGIPASKREKVFEHGYSTAESGTGLGLTIVRSIVEAHNWEMNIAESDQGGARFEVQV